MHFWLVGVTLCCLPLVQASPNFKNLLSKIPKVKEQQPTPRSLYIEFTKSYYKGTIDVVNGIETDLPIETLEDCKDFNMVVKEPGYSAICSQKIVTITASSPGSRTINQLYLTLTAASQDGERNGQAIIILDDLQTTPPSAYIEFTQSYYKGTIDEVNGIETDLPIETLEDCKDFNMVVKEPGYSAICSQKTVTITASSPGSRTITHLYLTLTAASQDGERNGQAIIILEDLQTTPPSAYIEFTQSYYKGTIDVVNGIETDLPIETLEDCKYFNMVVKEPGYSAICSQKTVTITASSPGSRTITHLYLTLTAASQDSERNGQAIIILEDLQTTPPSAYIEFTQSYYKGTIDEVNGIETDLPIETLEDCKDFNMVVKEPGYSAICSQKTVTITASSPGSRTINQLYLTLTAASQDGERNGQAIIILDDLQTTPPSAYIEFTQSYYKGTIDVVNGIETDLPIETLEDCKDFNMVVKEPGYSAICSQKTVTITASSPGSRTINQLYLTLTAASQDGERNGQAIIILDDLQTTPPSAYIEFTQSYYKGTIDVVNGIETDLPIETLEDCKDFNMVVKEPGYSAICSQKTVTITASSPGSRTITHLYLTLTAASQDSERNGQAIIILEDLQTTPPSAYIEFTQSYYKGTIDVVNGIETDLPIETLEDCKDFNMVVKEPGYSAICSQKTVTITASSPGSRTINQLYLTLTAASQDGERNGQAIIILDDLQTTPPSAYIEFTQSYYKGTIDVVNGIETDLPIETLEDCKDFNMVVKEPGYSAICSQKTVTITASSPGSRTINQLYLTLTAASQDGERNGQAIIILDDLQTTPPSAYIEFTQSYYKGTIDVVNGIETDLPIETLEDCKDFNMVVKEPGYSAICSQKTVTISASSPGSRTITHLYLTLTAASQDGERNGQAIIILDDLQTTPPSAYIEFTQSYYKGTIDVVNGIETDLPIETLEDCKDFNMVVKEPGYSAICSQKTVTITASSPGSRTINQLYLTLTAASQDGERNGQAIIILDDLQTTPPSAYIEFTQSYYKGTIDVVNGIETDLPIETLEDCKDFNMVVKEPGYSAICSQKTVTITASSPGSRTITHLYLTLTAASQDSERNGQAIIILEDLQTTPPSAYIEFTQSYYKGTIDVVNGIETDLPIETLEDCKDFNMVVKEPGYSAICSQKTVTITASSPGSRTINQLYLTLTAASQDGERNGQAIIILDDLQTTPPSAYIEFTQSYYKGTIDVVNGIETDLPIETLEDCKDFNMVVKEPGYSAICSQKTVTITASSPGSRTINQLYLTLTAASQDGERNGQAIIILDDLQTTPPSAYIEFTQSYYKGTIDVVNGIETDLPIETLEDCKDFNMVVKEPGYSAICSQKTVTITASSPGSRTINQLYLTLTAASQDGERNGQAIIILDDLQTTPPSAYIEFTQSYYKGTIDVVNGIETDLPIETLEDCKDFNMVVKEPGYSAICSQKTVTITASSPGSRTITHLYLTLTAASQDSERNGQAIIILEDLQTTPPSAYIEFTQSYYKGTIDVVNGIETDLPIETLEDCKDFNMVVKEPGYSAICSQKTVTITASSPGSRTINQLYLTLTAASQDGERNGQAIIILDDLQTTPPSAYIEFTQSYYKGTIDVVNGIETDLPIETLEDCKDFNMVVKEPGYSAICSQKTVTISASSPGSRTITHLYLTLTAASQDGERNGQAIIILDDLQTTPPSAYIEFTQGYYKGTIDVVNGIETDLPIETLEDCKDFNMVVKEYGYSAICSQKTVTITASSPGSRTINQLYLTLTAASQDGERNGQAIIILDDLQTTPPSAYIEFTQSYYKGTIDVVNGIETDLPIETLEDCKDFNMVVKEPGYSAICSQKTVTITASSPGSRTINQLYLTLTAASQDGERNGQAIIILDDLQTTPPSAYIEFTQSYYKGTIDVVNGIETDLPIETLEDCKDFNMVVKEPGYSAICSQKTVTITASSPGSRTINQLYLTLTAVSQDGARTGQTIIILDKLQPTPPNSNTAEYSHFIVTLFENLTEAQQVIEKPLNLPNYGYCLEEAIPMMHGIFENKDGGVICNYFQRESKELLAMREPQFLLTVELKKLEDGNCPTKTSRHKRETKYREGIIMKEYTKTNSQRTTITVLIEDINNNEPIIDNPLRTVVYPTRELVEYIRPPYLTKVNATDKDSPVKFGKITYFSGSPKYIEVNPETGEVYPTNALYDDHKKEYIVKACDGGNLCTEATIVVKILEKEQIATIEIPAKIENIDKWLEEQSDENITLRLLSVVGMYENAPQAMLNPFLRDDNTPPTNVKTKAIVYAVKTKEPETPLETTDIKEKLSESGVNIPVKDFEVTCENCLPYGNDVGLIVAVALLSILLLGVLIGNVVFYCLNKRFQFRMQYQFSDEPHYY